MGQYRLLVSRRTHYPLQLGQPSHTFEDAVYVGAITEAGARAAALSTWPDIERILHISEVCCN